MPGMLKTDSMTTEPPMRMANEMPACVTIWFAAFFSA